MIEKELRMMSGASSELKKDLTQSRKGAKNSKTSLPTLVSPCFRKQSLTDLTNSFDRVASRKGQEPS